MMHGYPSQSLWGFHLTVARLGGRGTLGLVQDGSRVYEVVVDAIALQGVTLRRGDRVTTNELGPRLSRLLRAGLLFPVADVNTEEEFEAT